MSSDMNGNGNGNKGDTLKKADLLKSLDFNRGLIFHDSNENQYVSALEQFEMTTLNEVLLKLTKMTQFGNWSEMAREVEVLKSAAQ